MGQLSFFYRQFFVHPPAIPSSITLKEQTILITGANSGIGLETARKFVNLGAGTVILAVRSQQKGEAAKADILSSNPDTRTAVEIWLLDLESFESVLEFGKRARQLARLDVAILNAGVFKFDWSVTAYGLEPSLQVNHISTALLSLLLLPSLRTTSKNLGKPSRLTFSSSEVHMWTSFEDAQTDNVLEWFNKEQNFKTALDHYSKSKLLNVFWARQLADHTLVDDIIINLINPGSVDTGLHRDNKPMQWFDKIVGRTPEEGARLLVDAAIIKGAESHGKYLSEAKMIDVSPYVRSHTKLQQQLWDETRKVLEQKVNFEDVESAFKSLV